MMLRLFFIINRSPLRFFSISRGIHQGERFSLFLFILMAKALGYFIHSNVSLRCLKGLSLSSSSLEYSHQQFVDYTIILGDGSISKVKNHKIILSKYEATSGQRISLPKSSIFFLNTFKKRQIKIAAIFGCCIEKLPSTYLGLHLCMNSTPNFFQFSLIDKFQSKLVCWKGVLLSQASKLQLIKSSPQTLPIYAMSLFQVLRKVTVKMEQIQKNFLQTGLEVKNTFHLVAWDQV